MSAEGTEQFREFINKLSSKEHRTTALNDLKNFLTYKSPSETLSTIRDAGISKIIHCVNISDEYV